MSFKVSGVLILKLAGPGRDGLGNAGFGSQRGADRLGIGERLRTIDMTHTRVS